MWDAGLWDSLPGNLSRKVLPFFRFASGCVESNALLQTAALSLGAARMWQRMCPCLSVLVVAVGAIAFVVDLWQDNVLLDTTSTSIRALTSEFVIIDWAGANLKGYGIYDLLRLARSMGLTRHALARELHVHARILGCQLTDSMGHLLASLGYLGMHLEHFPSERYVLLVRRCWGALSSLLT